MAVEIPVVIDIEQAFKDAAAKVKTASMPLQNSIAKLSEDLSAAMEKMNNYAIDSTKWKGAVKEVQRISELLDLAQDKTTKFGTNTDSIKQMTAELVRLERQWAKLGQSQKYTKTGELSGDAKKLLADYEQLTAKMRDAGKTLAQMATESEKLRQETATLGKTAKSLDDLNAKLQIYQRQLNAAELGSPQWDAAATAIGKVSNEIKKATESLYRYRTEAESIDRLNGRLQELNAQWNRMSATEKYVGGDTSKMTVEAKRILDSYRSVTQELKRSGQTLSQIIREEERLADAVARENKKRQEENAILNSTANTMEILQKKAQILSERLSKTAIGTQQFANLKAQLNDVQYKLRQVSTEVSGVNNAFRAQSGILKNVASYASMYVSVFGALRLVKQIRDVTGELEYQRVALGHLLQDVSKGNALFEQIKEAAIESPFRIKDLTTYVKQLAAYRIEQEALFTTTKRLADISAGLGVDMNRLILAYGQVRAASVLRGQELRQFTEAGIPLVEMLAEKFTDLRGEMVSTADVFKLISQRAVPFSMISAIFEDLTEKGGMFYKMQEEQAKTLKGRWEKLKDAYDIALQSVGDTESFQRANDIVLGGLRLVADNLRGIIKLVNHAVAIWASYSAMMLILGTRTKAVATAEQAAAIAEAVRGKNISGLIVKIMGQTAAEEALTAATTQATIGTNILTRALGKLKVALLTNPYLVLGAVILGLVFTMNSFKEATNDSAEAANTLNRAVDDLRTEIDRHTRIEKLIDKYEELSKVEEKTAAQTETLARVTKKLTAEFPEHKERLEDANLSLEERLKLVQELNEEEEKRLARVKQEKEEDLKAAEIKLKYAQDEADVKHQAKVDATLYYNALQDELDSLSGEGKKGRGAILKFFLGGNQYDETYTAIVRQREQLDEAEEAANKADQTVDELTNSIKTLREELYGTDEAAETTLDGWKELLKTMQLASDGSQLFTPEQFDGWDRLYDVSNDLEKEWKKLVEELEAMKMAQDDVDPKFLDEWLEDIAALEAKVKGHELIQSVFGFKWGKQPKSTSYTQDPFINTMQERMRFMQDFKKGYDDLKKYMSKEEAESEQAKNMLSRGLALGLDANEQKDAAEKLSEWYGTAIKEAFKKAQKYGAGTDLTAFLSRQITGSTNRDKALRDFQKLIQSLYDAQTDLDTSKLLKQLEESFQKMEDEMKRSETVRDFYKNILDLTGDQELATSLSVSVYGGIGEDFRDRMQAQLTKALGSLDPSVVTDTLLAAFSKQDFGVILQNLDMFPEEWRKKLKEMAQENEKYNASVATDLVKSLQKAKTYSEKRVELAQQTARRMAEIDKLDVSEDTKKSFRKQNAKKDAEEAAKLAYEAFKDTPMYVELFANLDTASTRMLENMRNTLTSLKSEWRDLDPTELKEMQSRINEINNQLASKNPFAVLRDSIKEYRELAKEQSREEADITAVSANERLTAARQELEARIRQYNAIKAASGEESEMTKIAAKRVKEQQKIVDETEAEANAAQEVANRFRDVALRIQQAAEQMQEWNGYITEALNGVSEIVETFASADTADTFNTLSEGLTKTLGGIANIGVGIGQMLTNPIAGAASIISGIGSVIGGIFGTANALKMKRINNEIEEQDDILHNLEKDYNALEKAINGAFGSEYVYNYTEQLKALEAQQAAYLKQAELEREKGKKADEEKIKEYEESAADTYSNIQEMQDKLAEHFAGTDVTSAARDFAKSWIDAYREFGSTTMAMREKFKEMIDNMVVESLAGQIMKNILDPIYKAINTFAEGGLDEQEIASIAEQTEAATAEINTTMAALMQRLAAAGLNMRGTAGGFSGIAKDIAGASEQSINGLAAGINTQNYYMSYMPAISADVALIRAAIAGEIAPTAGPSRMGVAAGAESQFGDELFRGQMGRMDANIAEIRNLLASVVSLPNTPTNTKVIAAKI